MPALRRHSPPSLPERLTLQDVNRIADLARLELSDDEKTLFLRQLAEVLDYADQIQLIDTTGILPSAAGLIDVPVDRPDDPQPSLPNADALSNAPDASRQTGLFGVPRMIG